tara:strand:- start:368 stop:742 length:375 start_codon:yes stop_codon:yes gene_type:complete
MLQGIFKSLIGNASEVIDEVVTTKEEKLALKNKMREILANAESNAQLQVTRRWEADAKAGWLPANIRPLTLIFLTFVFVVISVFDGNIGEFQISSAYLPIYQTLLLCCYSAYFAGRSFEKIKRK